MPTDSTTVKRHPALALSVFALCAFVAFEIVSGNPGLSIYGITVFALLALKLLTSLIPPRRYAESTLRVGAVVTIYNEDTVLLQKCLNSLLAQTQALAKIVLVDDHSTDLAAYNLSLQYAADHPGIFVVHRQPENLGKREGLAVGFGILREHADVFLCVDSDTILEPTAVQHGAAPMSDPSVMATTGVVVAANYDTNLLTRLIDVRYINAFLGERAAYSHLGACLCVCGSLAFYRASALPEPVVQEFLNQRFLGKISTVGDDRHLTNHCLIQGKVVLSENAIAHTYVPERMSHYIRQQARWGRSFFRESLWSLQNQPKRRPAFWLTLIEVTQWAAFTSLLAYVAILSPIMTGEFLIVEYLLIVAVMAIARSVRTFDVMRHDQSIGSQLASFAAAPLFGYLNLFIMVPLRAYSLATLKTTAWGTRKSVEVSAHETPDRAALGEGQPVS